MLITNCLDFIASRVHVVPRVEVVNSTNVIAAVKKLSGEVKWRPAVREALDKR